MTVKIGLDAGHGLTTSGKQTPDGIKEWTLNDKVRDKVVKILSPFISANSIFPLFCLNYISILHFCIRSKYFSYCYPKISPVTALGLKISRLLTCLNDICHFDTIPSNFACFLRLLNFSEFIFGIINLE